MLFALSEVFVLEELFETDIYLFIRSYDRIDNYLLKSILASII